MNIAKCVMNFAWQLFKIGDTMNATAIIILIVSAICLYGIKSLKEFYNTGVLLRKLEQASKIALRISLTGIVVVGLVCVAILTFPLFRQFGFAILSPQFIEFIRILLEIFLETRSVYSALFMFASVSLLMVELSLIFSIFGLFVTKRITIPCLTKAGLLEYIIVQKEKIKKWFLGKNEKRFLHFANLRI